MTRNRQEAAKYSVRKGKGLERRVANILCEWCESTGFRRSPGSGGFNKSMKTRVGEKEFIADIMSEDPIKFSIEVKSEKGYSLEAALENPMSCKFTKWWGQCCYDAFSVNKLPLLWFKNNGCDLIAFDKAGLDNFGITDSYFNLVTYSNKVSLVLSTFNGKSSIDINLPNPYIVTWNCLSKKNGKLIYEDKHVVL